MCGICCSIKIPYTNCEKCQMVENYTEKYLKNRGPDSFINVDLNYIKFSASVLWQQGSKICKQPLQEKNQIFLFNGDVFMERPNMESSDTEWLFNKLLECRTDMDIMNIFLDIKGPYSFIYFIQETKKLWFARDSLGRNSLLLGKTSTQFIITSVIDKSIGNKNSIELPPLGLFCIDVEKFIILLYPWQNINSNEIYLEQKNTLDSFFECKIHIMDNISPKWLTLNELNMVDYNFQDILKKFSHKNNAESIFNELFSNKSVSLVCNKLIELLSQSVKERVESSPKLCKNCIKIDTKYCIHCKIGILFSGGIDCSILAILADKFIENETPIDLINVAFERVYRNQTQNKKNKPITTNDENELVNLINWEVPDRISAKQTLEELRSICPNRKWNLVEVNVNRNELNDMLSSHISNLVFPLTTVLDESLGSALWFASTGKGILEDSYYESPCRVVLIGSGADEMFGGYTRHRNAFIRENNPENNITLKQELELDWVRLPSRNLARDDRVISDHGKTPRTPYLNEDLIHFVKNLEPLQKCYHLLEQGVGDKLLLRLCGFKLGLKKGAILKKKALQFGTRIADNKQNAKDLSLNLISK